MEPQDGAQGPHSLLDPMAKEFRAKPIIDAEGPRPTCRLTPSPCCKPSLKTTMQIIDVSVLATLTHSDRTGENLSQSMHATPHRRAFGWQPLTSESAAGRTCTVDEMLAVSCPRIGDFWVRSASWDLLPCSNFHHILNLQKYFEPIEVSGLATTQALIPLVD